MDKFKTIFAEKGKMACDKVQRICDKGVFNMMDIIKNYMMDSTFEIFCDVPINQQLENTLNLTEYFERGIKCSLMRLYNPFNKIEWLFQASALGKESRAVLNEGRPILSKMVDDCMKKMEDRGYTCNEKDFEPQNYIEAAIHTGFMENASREKTLFSFSDLIIAGYDTTGVATASTILYLAMHPEYQEKAYQEQVSLLGNSLEEPTRAELSRMEYLEMAFNESLRKISIPAILRVVSSQIEVDGYIIPEGAALYFNYNGITNDARYYEMPDDYYPDHFLPEKVAERPECAFMPFSFGSRGCPGRRLAMLSSKFILSMLLRRFKFTSPLRYEDIHTSS
uniref:Cytochrome P450 4c3 n=1 Tax=Lygus hesperus TaxID=30085 RepID=A0A0K8TIQ0_LYGHE